MTVTNGLLHLVHAHVVRRRVGPMATQELFERFRLFAVVHPGDIDTVLARIETRVGIGPVLQQQLGDVQVIARAGPVERQAVGSADSSGVFGSAPCSSKRRTMCK